MGDITKYNISYKTFDQLMFDIEDDFESYADQGLIVRDKYIKTIRTCNSRLGLKINPEKEAVVEVVNGVGKLPDDFKLLDFAFICAKTKLVQSVLSTYTEYNTEIPVLNYSLVRAATNTCTASSFVCDGTDFECTPYQVWKKNKEEFFEIYRFQSIKISPTSLSYCASNACPNYGERSNFYFNIEREGECYYIKTNLEDSNIYVRYVSDMIDDDDNLLILDNPLVLPYYEEAVKEKILENLYLNGIDDVRQKLGYVAEKLKYCKRNAETFVNISDFNDLKQVFLSNRRIAFYKYINAIK